MKFSFGSSGKKKNTKANRLRRMKAQIAKLEKKKALDSALKVAANRLKTLRK